MCDDILFSQSPKNIFDTRSFLKNAKAINSEFFDMIISDETMKEVFDREMTNTKKATADCGESARPVSEKFRNKVFKEGK